MIHFHIITIYLAQVTYNQVQPLQINYLASNHRGKIISAQHKDCLSITGCDCLFYTTDSQIMIAHI